MAKMLKLMSKKDTVLLMPKELREMLRTIQLFSYFRVHTCGNLTVPPGWHIEPRIIKDFHLLMVLGGRGTYVVGGRSIPLHRGRIIFLSNGLEYSAVQDLKDPPHIIPLRFFIYDNRTNRPGSPLDKPAFVSHTTSNVEKFQDMFESLHRQHLLNRGPFRTGYCSTIIHHILCDLLFECSSDPNHRNPRDARILKVRQFIANHPMDRSSVSDLAKMAELSEKYFTRLFRQQTGVTPKRYQLNSRLSSARVLLEEGMSVKETSFQMGYPDQFVFSKQFKALLGIPPSDVTLRTLPSDDLSFEALRAKQEDRRSAHQCAPS